MLLFIIPIVKLENFYRFYIIIVNVNVNVMRKKEVKMKKKLLLLCVAICTAFAFTSCGGNDTDTVTVGQPWVISDDNPLDGGNAWSITSHGISEYVFMQKEDGSLESRFVDNMEAKDDTNWELKLKKDVKFSDGTEVDAKAFASCLNEVQEKNKLSNASAGKITYTPTGDYTVDVKTERPTKDLKSILGEWTNVIFKKDGDKFVFTGPFKLKEIKAKDQVVLEPNKYYPNADQRPQSVTIKAFKDINSLKMAFESGEVDLAYGITGDIAKELEKKGKKVINFDAGYQYFTFLNLKNEILADKNVREALNNGISREDIIKTLDGGTLPTGLFAHYNSFDAKLTAPYDVEKAKALLDQAGWKMPESGKYRVKDGKELELKIKTYSAKPDLPKVSQSIASNMESLGIKASVEVVNDISKVVESKDYDMMVYAQHPSPAGTPVYFLNQFFRTDAPNNFTGYSSEKTDGILNEMGTASDKTKVDQLAIEAQKQIIGDMPVLLTVDPTWHAAVSDRIKDYKLWNGDYYIINSTLQVK